MPIYKIESPVIVFNHSEYGERLLFQQGETNPRNELGKNGVTLHRFIGSMFYETIQIEATQILENGQQEINQFNINRSSLIKYLGPDAHADDADQVLINKLQAKLWKSNLNQPNRIEKEMQSAAGEHLRHAGQHNQRVINHWSDPISDFFKGSFFSWLYQVTIRSINLIKVRFLFFGGEQQIFETGEILAKKRFHEAYEDVPAYTRHLTTFNGMNVADTSFRDIPLTTKTNYIKPQEHDSDTHLHGKYPRNYKTDTSTGTTGKPTVWVRGEPELDTVKKSLELAAKLHYGDRRLSYINAFALGPWATGLTSYELMRQTGSVFAVGPDKEKILDELLRIAKDDKRQLALEVEKFAAKNSWGTNGKQLVGRVIDLALRAMLQDRNLQLNDALNAQMANPKLNQMQLKFINHYKSEIKGIAETLNQERALIVIAGYPPFLKDLADYVKQKGHNMADFCAIGVVGGQAISEAMRDVLKKDGFNQIYSSYGASDLDINLGVETEDEMVVRQAIEKNPGLARELYGENKGLPMVFHYDTWNYHVECLDGSEEKPEDKDSLVFTTTRDDRSSPRIRYDLGDKGRLYAASDVQALLAKYGIFHKPRINLPLMFVWGRDSTVVFNGSNLAFTELERAIEDLDNNGEILKKAFYTYHDNNGVEKLEILLELNDDIEIPNNRDAQVYAYDLISKLASLNQDFRYQLESLDEGTQLPVVRFFTRGQSPISEAGGHRKQVLVFQKENLPENYLFPESEDCHKAVSIKMEPSILSANAQLEI
jgi:phenylacetate-coenzyme A ligase PaaK-like adenylate-forming protein